MLHLVHNQETEIFNMINSTTKTIIASTVILIVLAIVALAIFAPTVIIAVATVVVIVLTVAGMFYALGDKSNELN